MIVNSNINIRYVALNNKLTTSKYGGGILQNISLC